MTNSTLVYSTSGPCTTCGKRKCTCGKRKSKGKNSKTSNAQTEPSSPNVLRLRPERKGRGGKTVTILYDLPKNVQFCKDLTKRLKNHCGCGGVYKNGQIEIQGDNRDKIKLLLENEGYTVKLSGG